MKTLVYTGYNEAYRTLAEITVPRMMDWAQRHGYDFEAVQNQDLYGVYWTGVEGALKALKGGYTHAWYLDVDQLVTGDPFVWNTSGAHFSRDWGEDATEHHHFSMCGFLADETALPIFEDCLTLKEEWRDRPFPEQGPMQSLVRTGKYKVVIMNRRVFNAVPIEVHPSVVDPWKPGDNFCHLTMLPIEERVELAHKIIARL